jgi:hypothetical protein
MCLAVYISSDKKLPISEWIKDKTLVCFSELKDIDQPVKKLFSKQNAYYVSSYEGCGCGFLLDGKEEEELKKKRESYTNLADFLQNYIKDGEVEIFSCWEGDQDKPPTHHKEIHLNTLKNPDFCFQDNFEDRRFYKVSI